MTNDDLRRLQNTQYEILKTLSDICSKHQITYYLAYGTLLGAIRHQKSIPWDYDIDIFMDVKNFEQLQLYLGELPNLYEFKALGTKWGGLSRVYKKGTLMYDPSHGSGEAFPIHIDIFQLEYAKSYNRHIRKLATGLAKYLMVAKLSAYEKGWIYENFKNQPLKKFICRTGDLVKLFADEETIEHWVHNLIISDKPEKYFTTLHDLGKQYPVEYFGKGKIVQYEDGHFTAPIKTHELLTLMYGDYMKFPPIEERFTCKMDTLNIQF